MKKVMSSLAALAFCATAMAAGPNDPGGTWPAANKQQSWAKYHQVFGRLGLTDEQVKKIDALHIEYQKKSRDLYKEVYRPENKLPAAERRAAFKKIQEKVVELNAERDKKMLEVLTEAQKKKFEEANKIIAEFSDKAKELTKEYATIRQIKDRAKRTEAYKAISAKRSTIYTERDTQLDEKIGKLPERPAIRGHMEGRSDEGLLRPNGTK